MSTLRNIESLADHLVGNVEAIIDVREEMLSEISDLRTRLMERDMEAVKITQDMRRELEAAQVDALRFEQERIRIESRLQCLNDRLTALVDDVKHCGG